MKAEPFRKLLLEACLVTSAVDGDIDDSEIAVISNALMASIVGADELQDRIEELKETAEAFRVDLPRHQAAVLEELNRSTLTPGQCRRLLDLCCRVVAADTIIHSKEIQLLSLIIEAMGVDLASAKSMCAEHAGILSALQHDIQPGTFGGERKVTSRTKINLFDEDCLAGDN